jgi:hypothetical protein
MLKLIEAEWPALSTPLTTLTPTQTAALNAGPETRSLLPSFPNKAKCLDLPTNLITLNLISPNGC